MDYKQPVLNKATPILASTILHGRYSAFVVRVPKTSYFMIYYKTYKLVRVKPKSGFGGHPTDATVPWELEACFYLSSDDVLEIFDSILFPISGRFRKECFTKADLLLLETRFKYPENFEKWKAEVRKQLKNYLEDSKEIEWFDLRYLGFLDLLPDGEDVKTILSGKSLYWKPTVDYFNAVLS